MASRSSVNRPPTPEPEGRVGGGGEPTSLRQVVDAKLLESGEKERLKTLLRDRLEECGWADDLLVYARTGWRSVGGRMTFWSTPGGWVARWVGGGQGVRVLCPAQGTAEGQTGGLWVDRRPSGLRQVGRENVSLEELIRAITPKGRASVPGPVKAELLQRIQSFLTTK
ncbi:unnamed protein product [Closterium sp. NIES-54]